MPEYTKRKSYGSYLDYSTTGTYGGGHYQNQQGNTVRIYHGDGNENRKPYTVFIYTIEGISHEKQYDRTFSQRGLMKVAAALIYFVHNQE